MAFELDPSCLDTPETPEGDWDYEAPFDTGMQEAVVLWAKEHVAKSSGNESLRITLGLAPLPNAREAVGLRFDEYIKPKGARFVSVLSALDPAVLDYLRAGKKVKLDPERLIGKSCMVDIASEPDKRRGGHRARVLEWHPLGATQQQPQQPAQARPAQQQGFQFSGQATRAHAARPNPNAVPAYGGELTDDDIPF